MAYQAVIDNATGAVIKHGYVDFSNDYTPATQTIINLDAGSIPSENVPHYHHKIVNGHFTEMSTGEKAAVDAAGISPLMPSEELSTFLNENARVTDATSGITGAFNIMQTMLHRKELYNDEDNPLYDSGFTPILGASGWAEDHANRINNLETIVAKNGWLRQEITRGLFKGPATLLIYYGWMNSFNSASNGWDNEKVAQDMAQYDIIVLGNGLQTPTHGDYANTSVIIPRIKALKPSIKIFGYVSENQSLSNFQDKVDDWETLQVHGIFIDEAGYDYGTTDTNSRSAFNTKVDYVKALTYAKLCFVNAWNMDHIIGTTNDPSYPNTTWNSGVVASHLTSDDWYLLESFPINTTAYSSTGGYESKADWVSRGAKAISHRYTYGINLASTAIINNANNNGQSLHDFGFVSALMFSLEAYGSSDTSYGSGSAAVKKWELQDLGRLAEVWSLNPTIVVDINDSDVYWRFVKFGKLKLDFSTSEQTSSIYHDSRRYADAAAPPLTSLLQDGDRYYNTVLHMEMQYDSSRSQWLSVDAMSYLVGRNGSTPAGSYYNGIDGITYSDTRGYAALHNGTIVAFGYTRGEIDEAFFEITSGGTPICEVRSVATSGVDTALNANFGQGTALAVRNKSGYNTTTYVSAWVKVKWRL